MTGSPGLNLRRLERSLPTDDIGLAIGAAKKFADPATAKTVYGRAGHDYGVDRYVLYANKAGHDYNPKDPKLTGKSKEGTYFWTPKKELILPNEYRNESPYEWDIDPLGGHENVGNLIISGIGLGLLKPIPTTEGSAPDAIKNSLVTFLRQFFYTSGKREFPFITQRYGFWKGFSKVESYWTVEINNPYLGGAKDQRPILMLKEGEGPPSAEFIEKRTNQTFNEPQSLSDYLNARLSGLYNDVCAFGNADTRYMNGDIRDREDLNEFFGRLAKIDIHNIHQFGKEVYMGTVPVTITGGITLNAIVKKYEKPKGLGTYLPNEFLGNWPYDISDRLLYNIVQGLFGEETARQIAAQSQLEAHMKTRTALGPFFGGRPGLRHYT